MNILQRTFLLLTCTMTLLVGIQGGEFSAWTGDQNFLTEMAMETENDVQEEVKVDWFFEESPDNSSIPNPLVGPSPKVLIPFFSSLDQKAVENPPEHQV